MDYGRESIVRDDWKNAFDDELDEVITVGDTPAEASFFAVYSGADLPPEVQKLVDGS